MIVSQIIQTIGELNRPLVPRDVRGLSGLSRIDQREFLEAWARLPKVRRAELAREMIELAEENVALDFSEAWSWLLADDDPAVRVTAVEGLWENTSVAMMRRMLRMLRDDSSEDVRAAAAVALSRFAQLASLDELDEGGELLERELAATALDDKAPLEVRRRALESAGYFAENDAVQRRIERDYALDEQLLRESALVAMGRSMLPRWLPLIGESMRSDSPAIRYEACRAAGEMTDEARSLLPNLARLLNDRDTEVSLAAIWALGQIGGEAAERALKQMTGSEDEARSQAATEALEELRMGETLI